MKEPEDDNIANIIQMIKDGEKLAYIIEKCDVSRKCIRYFKYAGRARRKIELTQEKIDQIKYDYIRGMTKNKIMVKHKQLGRITINKILNNEINLEK